jgi:hypothetical protein
MKERGDLNLFLTGCQVTGGHTSPSKMEAHDAMLSEMELRLYPPWKMMVVMFKQGQLNTNL